MKIALVHFLVGLREGGTENITKNLAQQLVISGHKVDIYTNYGPVFFPSSVNVKRIPYIPMPIRHLKYLSMMVSFSIFTSLFLLFKKYDIIHGFFYVDSFLPMLVTKLKKNTKSVYTFGGVLNKEGRTGALADKCTALTTINKNVYSDMGIKNIEIIPNGTDTEKFKRNPTTRKEIRKKLGLGDKFTVLAIARPDEIKDPALLRKIIEASPDNVNFILIGISEAEPLKSMNKKNVFKLGMLPNDETRKYYSAADAFILTSKSEGMPTVLIEALSAGLPIISTKVGGIPDVVNNEMGFFIDRNPKNGSKIITKLQKNKTLLKKMSAACISESKQYDWKLLGKRYENLYRNLVR
jgi:glycosyltransferase involved in cell wall biosynthesis